MGFVEDPRERIEHLLAGATAAFRKRFLDLVDEIRNSHTLDELIELLSKNQVDLALVNAELAAGKLGAAWSGVFVFSANDTAQFLSDSLNIFATFDTTNHRAVEQMRLNQLRLVSAFTQGQRLATRTALVNGIARGLNPRQQALLFRETIGLSPKLANAVVNYRRLLEANSAETLTRALRDKRFDRTIRAALGTEQGLTPGQIDRMVARYSERALARRAESIARSEALRSVHQGVDEMYRQAIEQGSFTAEDLESKWRTAKDERVRRSHVFMDGQPRRFGEPFLSGDGNRLRYPGDIDAPASDTAECRCVKTTRIRVADPVAA